MKSFPMFIRTTDRRVIIAGGGETAAQKARLILKTDAKIILLAHDLEPELQAIVSEGRAVWHAGPITAALFDDAAMAFIGTGCPGIDASLHALARAARCPVNVVDRQDLCELTTPSIVDRDPIVIAIGSEGTAPVLTRDIKTKFEALLPRNIGGLAALAGRLRPSVAARVPRENRRALWAWVFKGAARDAWTRGEERAVAKTIKAAIENGGPPRDTATGRIALVGAGPGARDLLTLRAVEYLQEADVIFYDRLVDPDVLELARRDAERVYVGKVVGAHDWPQDRITAAIIAEARKGRRVVRLKSGDPMVFGRAGEETAAATAAGIPCDIVPGVTAACASAACLGRSLTERDVADTLVFATGTGSPNDPLPDCTRLSGPGTTTAFYMAVRQADRLSSGLMANGLPASAPVDVLVNVSKRNEKHFVTTAGTLASDIDRHEIDGCAILLITWPKAVVSKGVLPQSMLPGGTVRALNSSSQTLHSMEPVSGL